MESKFKSTGILHYSNDPIKLIVEVDPDISDFYRSLIPKSIHVNRPLFAPHISVVRNQQPPYMEYWNKYDGQELNFEYEHYVYNDELYYWLNAYSSELEFIRLELGLKPFGDVTWSPDGRHKFHITLANLKNKQP